MQALYSTADATAAVERREAPEPVAQAGEVVIQVEAFSLNRGELSLLAARPGWRPGQDVAGTVAQRAADGSGPGVGARVVAVVDQGGWAERVAAPTNRVGLLPEGVSCSAGATLGVAALTALRGLRAAGSLLGTRVLVTGASGGVGRFAVQLAHLGGAYVTAVAGAPERALGLAESGADRVVIGDEDLGGPFDAVMEGVGGLSLERSVRALAPGGVVLLYGTAAGEPARLGTSDFRGAPGSRLEPFGVYRTDVNTFGRDLTYLARLAGEGRLAPPVGLELGWNDMAAGVAALRARTVRGKVVFRVE